VGGGYRQPIDWVEPALYHLPIQELKFNFNFEIYLSNFGEIVTYPWPERNNVVDDQ
jgi:hypothetical protein